MIDVLLLVAADGEDDAVLEVQGGTTEPWMPMSADELPPDYGLPAWRRRLTTSAGRSFTILLSRAGKQRVDATISIATKLARHFEPTCLAMCGVCGGRPSWTTLGDVVVGSVVYRFDEGRNTSTTKDGATTRQHAPVIETYNLKKRWRQAAERFRVAGEWVKARPIERDQQAEWLLYELGHERDPRASPERARRCPDWKAVLASLRDLGLLDKNTVTLTQDGQRRARIIDDNYPDGLPDPSSTVKVIVQPFGTSGNLEARAGIWEELSDSQATVVALDMEASAVGFVADDCGVPAWIVGKGVMDYADEKREYGYRRFAARAAAEVIIELIRDVLDHEEHFVRACERRAVVAGLSLREVGQVEGDGKWVPGKCADLTDLGGSVARELSTSDSKEDPGTRESAVPARVVALATVVVATTNQFTHKDLLERSRRIDPFGGILLHQYPEVGTSGLRWADGDNTVLEIDLKGDITLTRDVTAMATLRKDARDGAWATEQTPGISVFALLQSVLNALRLGEQLAASTTPPAVSVRLTGVGGRTLSFDEADARLRPGQKTWQYTFWNHDCRPCGPLTIASSERTSRALTRAEVALALLEDLAPFFLFRVISDTARDRDEMIEFLRRIDDL